MAIVCKRVVFALMALALLCVSAAQAQSIFRLHFDTVTAQPGDTVSIPVRYSFTPDGSHDLSTYVVRFEYDSSEVHLLGYDFDSTVATPADDTALTGTSRYGISAVGQYEIDLTNPVLFRMRFRVDKQLADTAFLTWNSNVVTFSPSEGVDSIQYQNGWIRTPSVAGHVALQTPGDTVKGFTQGFLADSVRFSLPFIVSNIASAAMTSAWLTFTYDTTILSIASVSANTSEPLMLDSIQQTVLGGGFTEARIELSSMSGVIQGSDTLVTINFAGLVGLDTVSTAISDVSLRPVNANALTGTTDYSFDSIYLEGTLPMNVVHAPSNETSIEIYPNPASTEATIAFGGSEDDAMLDMYDELGRSVWEGPITNGVWTIPAEIQPGVYHVRISGTTDARNYSGDFVVAPR